ncbi:unnamed protein product [Effrenium voratum]|uniref:Uncharacterized protein n=1 Tax=Effrenium voratum TaxID=2562239 RepID=A0AA36IY57_9DINO|nr:unnamed protein product [Effrenium voratum]CAJ1395023.1 unnamed protein product [Effrenium voratum]CAJ1428293.1 unnamed protein product [Effrenium voratum]
MAELPSWITPNAKLVYVSRSSGKEMDVVVKRISNSQKAVCLLFGKNEMLVPFSQILEKNPLKLRDLEEVEDEMEKFFEATEGKWFDKAENLDPKVRLGNDKGKFAFQGPTAPPMMEIQSSPESEPEERRPKKAKLAEDGIPPLQDLRDKGSKKKGRKEAKEKETQAKEPKTSKEKEKSKPKEKDAKREKEKVKKSKKGE